MFIASLVADLMKVRFYKDIFKIYWKDWKDQKRYSETINWRTDNTMSNRNRIKRWTMNEQTLQRRLKIAQHEPQ